MHKYILINKIDTLTYAVIFTLPNGLERVSETKYTHIHTEDLITIIIMIYIQDLPVMQHS